MEFRKFTPDDMDGLRRLQIGYKREIGENEPTEEDFRRLAEAAAQERILFFGCFENGEPIGCCSVSLTFSTFDYGRGGVFEDFYLLPEYRHRGIARQLVRFAARESGASSLTVGCADCDLAMYRSLGFGVKIGNLLAYAEEA